MIKRATLIGLGLVTVSALALTAHAGYKHPGLDVTVGEHYFQGSIGSVRASMDEDQYIGCVTYNDIGPYSSSTSVICYARSIAGDYAMCSASGPADWQPLASLTPNSMLDVSFTNGACTTIRVYNATFWPVSVP